MKDFAKSVAVRVWFLGSVRTVKYVVFLGFGCFRLLMRRNILSSYMNLKVADKYLEDRAFTRKTTFLTVIYQTLFFSFR